MMVGTIESILFFAKFQCFPVQTVGVPKSAFGIIGSFIVFSGIEMFVVSFLQFDRIDPGFLGGFKHLFADLQAALVVMSDFRNDKTVTLIGNNPVFDFQNFIGINFIILRLNSLTRLFFPY